MKSLSDFERGFLSLAIDTDGSFYLIKVKSTTKRDWKIEISLSFSNNSQEFLNFIQNIIGSDLKLVRKKGSKNYKISYRHKVLKWLLPQLELIIKENRRKIAIKILNHLNIGINQYNNTAYYESELISLVNQFQKAKYAI